MDRFFSKALKQLLLFVAAGAIIFSAWTLVQAHFLSVYTQYGQSNERYNLFLVGSLGALEKSMKSLLPQPQTDLDEVRLYSQEKELSGLVADLPISRTKWAKGFLFENGDLMKIKFKIRGDNPNNWLHAKKSYRIKRSKRNLKNGIRKFNYVLPRDPALLNTLLGYEIAEMIGILHPSAKFVEFYINDVYEGLYLEIEDVDESFVRNRNRMPVNIYKGTPSRTAKPLYIDSDLFNNPGLWAREANFNGYEERVNQDLETLLSTVRQAVEDPGALAKLKKIAPVREWAKFSAYEAIMQSWHNYENNNMYILSDPWMGVFEPIAYDTIFDDSKSAILIDDPVKLDNAAHALMEIYLNDAEFLEEKYKILNSFLSGGGFEQIGNKISELRPLVLKAWQRDPSHIQFTLTNGFRFGLIWTNEMNIQMDRLRERLGFIQANIADKLANELVTTWNFSDGLLILNQKSWLPISEFSVCGEIRRGLTKEELRPVGLYANESDTCHDSRVTLASNRYKPIKNASTPRKFIAGDGFDILNTSHQVPTVFKDVSSVAVKYVGHDNHVKISFSDTLGVTALRQAQNFTNVKENEKFDLIDGDYTFTSSKTFKSPLIIKPGSRLKLSPGVSLIFLNKLLIQGTKAEPVIVERKDPKHPWGALLIIGPHTEGSLIENVSIGGGSGGQVNQFFNTGMFSLHNSQSVSIRNLTIGNNQEFDDLIHVLYSKDVVFDGLKVFGAKSDALDIDISSVTVINSEFSNAGNDAIDTMTSKVIVQDSEISGSGDKGISIGESSQVQVSGVTLAHNKIGIEVKDGSVASIRDTVFDTNEMQVNSYLKNWRYGEGGKLQISKSYFLGELNKVEADKRSHVSITNSFFESEEVKPVSKRVKFSSNQFEWSRP
jgi:hypothetical protein